MFTIQTQRVRVVVTCEFCGFEHHLAEPKLLTDTVHLICHGCEAPLTAEPSVKGNSTCQ